MSYSIQYSYEIYKLIFALREKNTEVSLYCFGVKVGFLALLLFDDFNQDFHFANTLSLGQERTFYIYQPYFPPDASYWLWQFIHYVTLSHWQLSVDKWSADVSCPHGSSNCLHTLPWKQPFELCRCLSGPESRDRLQGQEPLSCTDYVCSHVV